MNNLSPIPETWKLVKCQEIIDVRDGTHDTPAKVEIGIPLVTSKNLKAEGIDFSDVTYISEADYLQIEKRSGVDDGDIIFAMIGTIGNPVIVKKDRLFSIKNVALFKLGKAPVTSEYFKSLLSTEFIKKQLESATRGGNQKFVSLNVLRNLIIPLPPIAEQKRIAAILDKAEEIRSQRRQALEQLDAIAQSIFLEMFGDVGATSRFPVRPLKSILSQSLQNGAYFPKEFYVEDGGIEMVHMSDAFYNIIARGNLKKVVCNDDEFKKYSLSENDILIARRSLTYEGAAKPCLIPPSSEPLIFESSFIRVTPDLSKVGITFLFNYLNNEWVKQKCIRPYVTQSTISGINQSNLERVPVLIPPIALQQEFARRVEAIAQLKTTHRESLTQLDALFASLQHRAFRGEL
jgi:type I restriction enzyme, S subunit